MLKVLLNSKNMSVYKLEKTSHVSHATLNDLYNERTNVEKCSSSLIHDIAKALNMSMDKLYAILTYDDLSLIAYNDSFDLFKSNVCHELSRLQYKEFIKYHLKKDSVRIYFDNKQYLESLYLLSMIDYLCISNNLPVVKNYNDIRQYKFKKMFVPKSIYLILKYKNAKMTDIYDNSISTFLDHNILEANIYDVR